MQHEALAGIVVKFERQAQHVAELDAVFKYRFVVVFCEKITINAVHPKTMALIECQLVAKRAGANLQPARAGFPEKNR